MRKSLCDFKKPCWPASCVDLDQVLLALGSLLGPIAVSADSADDQAMARDAKLMIASDQLPEVHQFVALEFNQLLAMRAIQVIMFRIAIIVFVDGSSGKFKLAQ